MPSSRSGSPTSVASPVAPEAALRPALIWWSALRPATLAVSVSAVLAGMAVAVRAGPVRTAQALGALVVALAIQVGVNLANDYSDHIRGADYRRVGPPRAASSGVISPRAVRRAALVTFAVAAAAGAAVSLTTDWRLLLVGAACVAAAWAYTGGPWPYGYRGLGEVFVFVFFGLVAAVGTTYVASLRIPPGAWAAGAATGFLACAVLAVNNLRDRETDREAGKRTLAVRLGPKGTRMLIAAFLAGSLAAPLVAAAAGWVPWTALLPLVLLPWMASVVRATGDVDATRLVRALKRTAELEVWWALLWTLGLLLGR
jgi:1,4-dihydroxy-2-naphthoate octaprenyltransferase